MRLDEGDIKGGFEHLYEARIIPTPDTTILHAIESSTGIDRNETIEVEVTPEDGRVWTHGFTGRWNKNLPSSIFTTPNPYVLGVRIQGVAYTVDVQHPDDAAELEVLPLTCAASDIVGGRMFLADETRVSAFDGVRILWVSDRVSLDGISSLTFADGIVRGVGVVPGSSTDHYHMDTPFEINASTGEAKGGLINFFRPA